VTDSSGIIHSKARPRGRHDRERFHGGAGGLSSPDRRVF